MFSKTVSILTPLAAMLFAATGALSAQGPQPTAKTLPFISTLFGDNMVLQRGEPDAIWGWSDPGDTIRVQFDKETATAVAGPDRRWQVKIQPPPTGGPYTVKITGRRQTVEIKNVLVGDVWLCGGQSNMEVGLSQAKNGAEEVKAANQPEIRYFTVAENKAYTHREQAPVGSWKVVTPETANRVSAVGYYFALRVREDVHVPIGLLQDNVGGTPAEGWTSAEALHALGDFEVPLALVKRMAEIGAPETGVYMDAWYLDNDQGLKGNWAALDVDESSWKAVDGPGDFKPLGVPDNPALAWYRRTVTLPDPLPTGQPALSLGAAGRGTTYLNGTLLGGRGGIPAGLLMPGKNVVATRVLRLQAQGGGPGRGGSTEPRLALGETAFPLTGEWKGRISVEMRKLEQMPIQTMTWATMPTVHYEGMLTPVAPFSITGALWYQGEQNTEYAYPYRRLLPVMVADWRKLFGQGNFPFYSVSLPAFKQRSAAPVDDTWAEVRESQAVAAAAIPDSCLAITIDTGDASNLHPPEKAPVGDRLARCALAKYYGVKIVYSGPILSTVERPQGAIRLHFANTDGGLVVKGDKLGEFSIAGEDRKWVWADARIEGDTVVVSSPAVPNPKEVRYAWQGNPVATLFNGAGLPAGPFRTDTWPLVTEGRRPY